MAGVAPIIWFGAAAKVLPAQIYLSDGTVALPSYAFTNEPSTGWFRNGAGNPQFSVLNTLAIDAYRFNSSQVNLGFNTAASTAQSNPFSAQGTYAGSQYWQYGNTSQNAASQSIFQILNGSPNASVSLNLANSAYLTSGYLAGACWITAGSSCAPLFYIANEYSGGNITFGIGGRTSANAYMVLATTGLTLNAGAGTLNLSGYGSGVVSITTAAAAGTYNFVLPATVGTSGYALLSAAGGTMTWGAVLTNPATAAYDMLYQNAGNTALSKLANGTTGQSLIATTSSAPTWGYPVNIAGGAGGSIHYQSAANATAMLANGSQGQVLQSAGGTSAPAWANPINGYNFLVNSALDYWQVATTNGVTATGGGSPTATYQYMADQWYVNNILGGGTIEGAITWQQLTAAVNGSGFNLKAYISTAPTGTGIQNGLEIYQALSNKASLGLYGQTASFSIQIRGYGNVTQVGLQFCYATSEAKPTIFIGSETLVTVNTLGYTLCQLNGQALGTSQTQSGIIGIRIRPTAVSSGNLYDLNTGLSIEQGMLNLGAVAAPWQRQNSNPALELAACQYFYEKSYDLTSALGTSGTTGSFVWPCFAVDVGGDTVVTTPVFKTIKRVDPTMSYWDLAGNSTKVSTFIGAGTRTDNTTVAAAAAGAQSSAYVSIVVPHLATAVGYQWVADARI